MRGPEAFLVSTDQHRNGGAEATRCGGDIPDRHGNAGEGIGFVSPVVCDGSRAPPVSQRGSDRRESMRPVGSSG